MRAQSSAAEPPPEPGTSTNTSPWSVHGQTTFQLWNHGPFTSPYSGPNSLLNETEHDASLTATLFVGRRLWSGGELYVNPEIISGTGPSDVRGLAGPPNGETYRVDTPHPKISLARVFLRQTFELGGETEALESEENQLPGQRLSRRVVLTGGKFSVTDVFDSNTYGHDPRTQFNNWSLWANAAWDYPADTRGYTWGLAIETYLDAWAVRAGTFLEPKVANGLQLDHQISEAHGDVLEIEHAHSIDGQTGVVRVLAYLNHARMGSYSEALALNPEAPDVTATREPGRTKHGFGINLEQAITLEVGFFLRAGWNDGKTESWAFTEVERTLAGGLSIGGKIWNREPDRLGLAFGLNGINRDHREYLAAGGLGFMLGDGRLNYAPERVIDAYYSLALGTIGFFSLEAQRYENPAFNRDRGPATLYGGRLHFEF
jgi:hypothetical protein